MFKPDHGLVQDVGEAGIRVNSCKKTGGGRVREKDRARLCFCKMK